MRKYILPVGAIALLTVVICGSLALALSNWASYSPSAYPLQLVQLFLQTVENSKSEPSTEEGQIWAGQCWGILQEAMTRNNNQYNVNVVGIYGSSHGTPIFGNTGATLVIIEVAFPDGARVEMDYYEGTLEGCRSVGK
jgi:hypothetical protein